MDAWEDDFKEPTEDERSARRVVALAIALLNARRPMTTTHVREEFYGSLADETFRKAYQRDRAKLASAGISVVRQDLPTGEPAWRVDEFASYAADSGLSPQDALALDCLLLPLASDASFPYAHDLRLALTKIDRSFRDPAAVSIPREARARNRQLTRIEECLAHRHAARVSYVRVDGSQTDRTIVALGLFPLRGTTYLVASRLDDDILEEPHVYNLDRMRSVRELRGKTYPVPLGFDVRDYVRLPFQLGTPLFDATFVVPERRLEDARRAIGKLGSWSDDQGTSTVRLSVSDADVAAAWSIAVGLRPVAPAELVDRWRDRLIAATQEGASS